MQVLRDPVSVGVLVTSIICVCVSAQSSTGCSTPSYGIDGRQIPIPVPCPPTPPPTATPPTDSPTVMATVGQTGAPTNSPTFSPTFSFGDGFETTWQDDDSKCYNLVVLPISLSGQNTTSLYHAHAPLPVEDDNGIVQVRMVAVGKWSESMAPDGMPATITDCDRYGEREVGVTVRVRNVTMDTAFVPGLTYKLWTYKNSSTLSGKQWLVARMGDLLDDINSRPWGGFVRDGLLATGRSKILDLHSFTENREAIAELDYREQIAVGPHQSITGNTTIQGIGGRVWCPDKLYGVSAVLESSVGSKCKWVFPSGDVDDMGYKRVSGDSVSMDVYIKPSVCFETDALPKGTQNTRCQLEFGNEVFLLGLDMRARRVLEADTVYNEVALPEGNTTTFKDSGAFSAVQLTSGNTFIGSDTDRLVFSTSPTMRAALPESIVVLKSMQVDMLSSYVPVWERGETTVSWAGVGGDNGFNCADLNNAHEEDARFIQPLYVDPGKCFVSFSYPFVVESGVPTSFALSTDRFGVMVNITVPQQQTSNRDLGPQVVLDMGSGYLFRMEYNSEVKMMRFWVGINTASSSDCNQSRAESEILFWKDGVRTAATDLFILGVDYLFDLTPCSGCLETAACLPWESPQPCSDIPSSEVRRMSLCGGSSQTMHCMDLLSQCYSDTALDSPINRRMFSGRIHSARVWTRRLNDVDMKVYHTDKLVDVYNALALKHDMTISHGDIEEEQDRLGNLAWEFNCYPDVIVGTGEFDAIQWGNRYGGVRCIARSVRDESREIDFIPVISCHTAACNQSHPYLCTDENCYTSPEACERLPVHYTEQLEHYEAFEVFYTDQRWLSGSNMNDYRLNYQWGDNSLQRGYLDRTGHTQPNQWMVYPWMNQATGSGIVHVRCDPNDPGHIQCIANSDNACVTTVETDVTKRWNFVEKDASQQYTTRACSDFYLSYPPHGDDSNMNEDPCHQLRCYPWGKHASREEMGVTSGVQCGDICWAPTTLGESFKYYSFITTKKIMCGSSGNDCRFHTYCFCYAQQPPHVTQNTDNEFSSEIGERTGELMWEQHKVCPELQQVLDMDDVPTGIKLTQLTEATKKLSQRMVAQELSFIMKVPTLVSSDPTLDMLLPDINVDFPNPTKRYETTASASWTATMIVNTFQDHTRTPMSIGTTTTHLVNDFRSITYGLGCHEFRRFDPVSNAYNPEDKKLCFDGSVITKSDSCHGSRQGTLLCPASSPIKCKKLSNYLTPYGASGLRLQVTTYIQGLGVEAIHSIALNSNSVVFQPIDNANIDGMQISEDRKPLVVKMTMGRSHMVKLSAMIYEGDQMLDYNDQFLQEQSEHYATLYFMQHYGTQQGSWWETLTAHPWIRIFPVETGGYTVYPSSQNKIDLPMVVFRCVPPQGSFTSTSWVVKFYSEDDLRLMHQNSSSGLHSILTECDNFAMRIPSMLGVSSSPLQDWTGQGLGIGSYLTPFPIAKDWQCAADVLDCQALYDVDPFYCHEITEREVDTVTTVLGIDYLGNVGYDYFAHTKTEVPSNQAKCLVHDNAMFSLKPGFGLKYISDFSVSYGVRPELQTTDDATVAMWITIQTLPEPVFVYHQNFVGEGAILAQPSGHQAATLVYMFGTRSTFMAAHFNHSTIHASVKCGVSIPLGASTHVAVVRDLQKGTVVWYVNGTQVGVHHPTIGGNQPIRAASSDHYSMRLGVYLSSILSYPWNVYASKSEVGNHTQTVDMFMDGEIQDFVIYNQVISAEHIQDIHNERSVFGIPGLYSMPWGSLGDHKLLSVFTPPDQAANDASVWWNNCEFSPVSTATCQAGVIRNNSLVINEGQRNTYIVKPDVNGNLELPAQSGSIVLTRIHALELTPCNFSNVHTMFRCDVGQLGESCFECSVGCDTPSSIFRIRSFTGPSFNWRLSQCLTFGGDRVYLAPCRGSSHQSRVRQMFTFNLLDSETGRAQLKLQNLDVCIFVREFQNRHYLGVDYSCTLWTSMRFLREGLLLDSDDVNVYTRAVMDTLHNKETVKRKAIVTYSVTHALGSDQGNATVEMAKGVDIVGEYGLPDSYFSPVVSIGKGAVPKDSFNTFRSESSKYGNTGFVFSWNRIGVSNRTSFVPANGMLKGRNWDVVMNQIGTIDQSPGAKWEVIRATAEETVVRINKNEQMRVFNSSSIQECKRMCELSVSCAAVSWYPTLRRCVHGNERRLINEFDAVVVFSLHRGKSVEEVLDRLEAERVNSIVAGDATQRKTVISRIFSGPIDLFTNRPSIQTESIVVEPLHPYRNGIDHRGVSVTDMCIAADFQHYPQGSVAATNLRIKVDNFVYIPSFPRFRLHIVAHNNTALPQQITALWPACQSDAFATVLEGNQISLPLSCIKALMPNTTYFIYAKSTVDTQMRLLFATRFQVCYEEQQPPIVANIQIIDHWEQRPGRPIDQWFQNQFRYVRMINNTMPLLEMFCKDACTTYSSLRSVCLGVSVRYLDNQAVECVIWANALGVPTLGPTSGPSLAPTEVPSLSPTTPVPTSFTTQTATPTQSPTTIAPTQSPTLTPSHAPTAAPSTPWDPPHGFEPFGGVYYQSLPPQQLFDLSVGADGGYWKTFSIDWRVRHPTEIRFQTTSHQMNTLPVSRIPPSEHTSWWRYMDKQQIISSYNTSIAVENANNTNHYVAGLPFAWNNLTRLVFHTTSGDQWERNIHLPHQDILTTTRSPMPQFPPRETINSPFRIMRNKITVEFGVNTSVLHILPQSNIDVLNATPVVNQRVGSSPSILNPFS